MDLRTMAPGPSTADALPPDPVPGAVPGEAFFRARETEVLQRLLRDQMGAAANLTVPLDVSVGVGRSWHEAAH